MITGTLRDTIVEVTETTITATAPATAAGFSDLIIVTAMVHEKWKISMPNDLGDPDDEQ